jgi:hypothetical protein
LIRNPGRQEEQESVVITSIFEEISFASARAQLQASGTLEPIESLILILFLRSCLPNKKSAPSAESVGQETASGRGEITIGWEQSASPERLIVDQESRKEGRTRIGRHHFDF